MLTSLWNDGNQPLQWGVVIGVSLVAAVFDIARRRIPNLLTGPVMLAGLAWASAAAGWAGLAESAIGCVVLMLPFLALFIFAGGGAGDAKLMGALGCWLGLINGLATLFVVSLAGIVMAVVCSLAKQKALTVFRNIALIIYGLVFMLAAGRRALRAKLTLPATEKMQTMPYGVAIFAGTCLAAVGVTLWRIQQT